MQNDDQKRDSSEKPVADLLRSLSSANAGAAWVEFLDRYSSLIMKTAGQFEYRHDSASDCYLYVCERLNDDGFRRLLKFNTSGNAKFRTWLGTVVFNLCVDWHRHEFGRATLLPAISALPAFDRAVYRLVVEQGYDKETCFQMLGGDFPDLTRELIGSSLIRIYTLLSPQQRWQVSVRNRRKQLARGNTLHDKLEGLPDPQDGPEAQAQLQQDLDTLNTAMAVLPARQRLLLRLRFQEGVSLKKIAEMTNLGDTNRAWRHLQAALEALLQLINDKKNRKVRKSP